LMSSEGSWKSNTTHGLRVSNKPDALQRNLKGPCRWFLQGPLTVPFVQP
jgi:hypothetical protein